MGNNVALPAKRHVFIIEDNELLVKMYRTIFGAMGFGVVHASTQGDAKHLFEASRPDLFIVDDDDGTGVDTLRAIRARYDFADVPVITTVTRSSPQLLGELQAAGTASVVTKPLQVSSFSALARKHLGARDGTDTAA